MLFLLDKVFFFDDFRLKHFQYATAQHGAMLLFYYIYDVVINADFSPRFFQYRGAVFFRAALVDGL
jgi:hypothetical protein